MSEPNYLINVVWNWIRAHKFVSLIVAVGLALLLAGLLWLAGVNVFNKIGSGWYKAKTYFAQREIDSSRQEAAEAKAIATQALKELGEEKMVRAQIQAEREAQEKILVDKSLTASEKLRAYEAVKNKPISVTPVTDDIDALCARAKALGISCSN